MMKNVLPLITPGKQPTNNMEGGHLTGEEWMNGDKEALSRLLKIGLVDVLASSTTISLDANEELARMVPLFCTYFSREELAHLIGEDMTITLFDTYRLVMLQNLVLEDELRNLLQAFREAGIPLLLFKGPALAYTVYPNPHLRTYHDIDVLIHADDIARIDAFLTERGYTAYEEYRANTLDKNRTGYNYTLKLSNPGLKVLVELHTAPHAGEISAEFDAASLWERAQSVEILGEQVLIMNPQDHLLYLCWHFRFHWFSRMLWLYDLVVMVRTLNPVMDWNALLLAARRQHLATTLYYCLSWCHELFGVPIPKEVFAQLRPPLACRLIVERITMPEPAKALVSPKWEKRRILAHRAMVDSTSELLVEGKLTFFPAPVILGRRYMEHSRLPLKFLFLYYFIHPWITLAKGCRYLLKQRKQQ